MYHIENMLKDLVPFPRKINICTDKNVNKFQETMVSLKPIH